MPQYLNYYTQTRKQKPPEIFISDGLDNKTLSRVKINGIATLDNVILLVTAHKHHFVMGPERFELSTKGL